MLKRIDKEKAYPILLKIACIFILLQPIFDVLSYLYIRGHITIGISTFGKPFIAGLINVVLALIYKKQFWRCVLMYGAYLVLMIAHSWLLVDMHIDTSTILHEIRFMINVLYFLICYQDLRILYEECSDKEGFFSRIKKTLIVTFALYIFLYLVSVITGTASMTYEYSDYLKKGYKGWMDSGQIFGHALCVCLPFLISSIVNNRVKNSVLRVLLKFTIVFPLLVLCLIGTKVSYYIAIIVTGIQIGIELFYLIKDKKISHFVNVIICAICVGACILAYPLTPVKENTDINNSVLADVPNSDEISEIMKEEIDKQNTLMSSMRGDESEELLNDELLENVGNESSKNDGGGLTEVQKNYIWTSQALSIIQQKYADAELHPSDMRNKQLVFSYEKFQRADLKYKLFGIGYVINGDLAIERDVLCMLFCFGIFGFLIVLSKPIALWFKALWSILKNPFKVKMSHLCLFEGFSMFFFISWYAGATFIYTNFAIFLAILMVLLNHGTKKSNDNGEAK